MPRRFIYLINPIAGTKGKEAILKKIIEQTTAWGMPFEILPTSAKGEYSYLASKISEEKITDVIICGGDGTINQVAAALLNVNVSIGIIPVGSGNGLARAARIPMNAGKALDIILSGNFTFIDSFYINERFSCMLCGLGFDAQVAHDFAKQEKRGLVTYIKQSILHFSKAFPYPFNIIVDDKKFSTEAFFISIANSNQFGNNFTIAPKASLSDGKLDIVIVNKMSKMRLVWSVFKQIRQGKVRMYGDKKYHHNEILYFQAKELQIENILKAPLHIDGDPAETAAFFSIKIIPGAFRLLMPQ